MPKRSRWEANKRGARRDAYGDVTVVENRKLQRTIKAVLKDVFGASKIGDIHVVRSFDEDGDRILRVYVVFKGTEDQFDATRASGVVRHMRPRLAAVGEQAFPIISYVSSDEMGGVMDAVA